MFIEPAEDWHIIHDGIAFVTNVTYLNLTWEIVDLTSKTMDMKINFSDPLAISPLIRFDKLVIILDDVENMFEKTEAITGRRSL